MYSLFSGTPSPHAIKYITDKKHVVCNRASLLCGLTRTYLYYLHESTNHVDLPKLVHYPPRGPGDAATRNAAVLLFWGQQL